LKTITTSEEETLKAFLPDYYEHVRAHPDTLLNRYLANFGMRARNGRHIRFVAMSSVFNEGLEIDLKFDLKGSTIGRFATTADAQQGAELDAKSGSSSSRASEAVVSGALNGDASSSTYLRGSQVDDGNKEKIVTLKDLDLVNPLWFEPRVREKVMQLLEADSALLERHNIMDYSLLLGMSEAHEWTSDIYAEKYGADEGSAPWFIAYQRNKAGQMRKYRVSMGIIDVLQVFSTRKKAEYAWKVTTYCNPNGISVNPPGKYRQRFVSFFQEKFLSLSKEQIPQSTFVDPP